MKKTLLIKAGLLTAASAVTLGAGIAPAAFAAETSGDASSHVMGDRNLRPPMMGPVGTVSAVTQNGDGTGTVTLTLEARPENAPRPTGEAAEHVQDRIERFREEHPDAPKPGDSVTVNYDDSTKFMINGTEASASELTVGTKVRVLGARFDSDTAAKVITTDVKPPAGRMHRGITAVIESVDAATNSFKVLLPARGEHEAQVILVQYSDDTTFKNGQDDATENDLSAGDRVQVNGKLNVEEGTVSIGDVKNVVILE